MIITKVSHSCICSHSTRHAKSNHTGVNPSFRNGDPYTAIASSWPSGSIQFTMMQISVSLRVSACWWSRDASDQSTCSKPRVLRNLVLVLAVSTLRAWHWRLVPDYNAWSLTRDRCAGMCQDDGIGRESRSSQEGVLLSLSQRDTLFDANTSMTSRIANECGIGTRD